jgi:hypothetical protein
LLDIFLATCIHTPSGSGYTKIYSNGYAFAALKADGSINTELNKS